MALVIEKPENAIEGQYIFFLDEKVVMPDQVKAVAEELLGPQSGVLLQTYEGGFVGFAGNNLDDAKALAIGKDKRVTGIGQDCKVQLQETQANASWNLDRIDSLTSTLDGKYDYMADGSGVHVYVVDSGIRATHQEFGGRVTGGKTFINDGKGTDDCNGHGTHVAGVIGGAQYGVAKGVWLHPVRITDCNGQGAASSVLAAVSWLEQELVSKSGAFQKPWPMVINMSLTLPKFYQLESEMYTSANNYKFLYVIAAGDDNRDAGMYSPIGPVNLLTVASMDKTDTRAATSNHQNSVQMFAPGVDIMAASHTDDTSAVMKSGTSMAAAHVSGVAAMYLQTHPGVINEDLRKALLLGAGQNLIKDPKNVQNNMLYSRISDVKTGFQDLKLWDLGGTFSDIGGITAQDMYWQSIRFADVTGDGKLDVCNLSATGLGCLNSLGTKFDTYKVWAPDGGNQYPNNPSIWQTVSFPDLNGDGKADYCVRISTGLQCGVSNGSNFVGNATPWDTYYSDGGPWDENAAYWQTIKYADINGDKKMDVCGRAANGIVCQTSDGTKFTNLNTWTTTFDDASGWAGVPSLWGTINFADVNGDGKMDVCGRSSVGIVCGVSNGTSFVTSQWDDYFADSSVWDDAPAYWGTIQFPDINGDKMADVCGRAENGIVCRLSTGTKFGPVAVWEDSFSDATGWNASPIYWGTISHPDVNGDGKADVCGRSGDGVRCALSTGTRFAFRTVWSSRFNDVDGWGAQPYYWGLIRYPDINGDGKADVCGRSGDGFECGLAP